MIETLGVLLFCFGFLSCAVAYAILVASGVSCSAYRESVARELGYLSAHEIDERVDVYLNTLVYAVYMFGIGFLAGFVSLLLEPRLFYMTGIFLGALYLIVFVYESVDQIACSNAIIEGGKNEGD